MTASRIRELEIELKAALELVERLREDNKKLFVGWSLYEADHSKEKP